METDLVKFLKGYRQGHVYYKKTATDDGHYLYAFRDIYLATKEEKDYTTCEDRKNEEYEMELIDKRKGSGTIAFISIVDIDPVAVYLAYMDRWSVEGLFQLFKYTLDIEALNVQKNYSLYVTEFINFISAVIASKVWNRMKSTILRKKSTPLVKSVDYSDGADAKEGKKTKTEYVYVRDEYCFKELFIHLSKVKIRRVGYTDDWKVALIINKLRDICKCWAFRPSSKILVI